MGKYGGSFYWSLYLNTCLEFSIMLICYFLKNPLSLFQEQHGLRKPSYLLYCHQISPWCISEPALDGLTASTTSHLTFDLYKYLSPMTYHN